MIVWLPVYAPMATHEEFDRLSRSNLVKVLERNTSVKVDRGIINAYLIN